MIPEMVEKNDDYCPAYEGLFHCCSILQKIVNLDERKMRRLAHKKKSLILKVEDLLSILESCICLVRNVDRESRPDDGVELFGDFTPPCPFDEYRKQTCESIQISTNKLSTSKILARGRQSQSGATGTATPSALKYKKKFTKKISSRSYNDIRKTFNESLLHEVSDDFIDLEEYEDPVQPFTESNESDVGDMMVSSASLIADFPRTADSQKDSNGKEETTRTTSHTSYSEEIIGSYCNGVPQNSTKQLSVRPKNSNLTKGTTGCGSDDTNLARPGSYEKNTGNSAIRTKPTSKYKHINSDVLEKALKELQMESEYINNLFESLDSVVTNVEQVPVADNVNDLIGEVSGVHSYIGPQNLVGASNPVTFTRNYSNRLPQISEELSSSLEYFIGRDDSSEDDEVV